MAVVYLATDLKHGRRVALKVLRPELTPALGLVSLRTTVFVDSAGTVRAVHAGPLSEHNLAEGLAAILPLPTTAAPATGFDSTK